MLSWLKMAFFRGLVILIPLVLLWVTLRELAELLVAVAEPIADFFPKETFSWVINPELVAPLFIVVIALVLGGLSQVPLFQRTGAAFERSTIGHLPLYRMIKTFISAFLELEDADSFRPALIVDDEGGAEPCYVIEDNPERPTVVVLVPWSPASFAGSVKLVPRQRIHPLSASFDDLSLSLANFGMGLDAIVNRDSEAPTPQTKESQ